MDRANQNSRREFFKRAGQMGVLAGVATLFSGRIGSSWLSAAGAEERRRGAGAAPAGGAAKSATGGAACLNLPLAEPGKGMAATLNYQHVHSAVKDAALKTERNGLAFEKQFCNNCALYKACGTKGKDKVGECTVLPGVVVKDGGWCSTWNKKA